MIMPKIAVYPGSFDPITSGHLDIIKRSSKLFDRLIVVVMTNYKKANSYSFSVRERVGLIEKCTSSLENISVDCSDGLLADFAKENGASFIVKGLRAVSDFEDEFQQALINKRLNEGVETVFFPADSDHMFLSSGMIKQICFLGGDVSRFLPKEVADEIIIHLRNNN